MTARELRGRLTAVGIIVTLPAPLEIELDAVVSGSIPPEWLAEAKAMKTELRGRVGKNLRGPPWYVARPVSLTPARFRAKRGAGRKPPRRPKQTSPAPSRLSFNPENFGRAYPVCFPAGGE